MVSFPNCKINLGLNILRKREDNYHDLETVFYPVKLNDVLEIIPSNREESEFIVTGLDLKNDGKNLCIKAYELLKKDFPELPFIRMHLHKAIPAGAGLGGGSADAAFTLKLLNDKFSLNLSLSKLQEYALQLGSDCPFFILNKTSFATGLGQNLQPIQLNLSEYKILLIYPGIEISTTWAFSKIKPSIPAKSILEIIKQPIETWKNELVNDFEIPVFETYPELKKIKEDLYNKGAIYSSLSGSGSTVFGLFKKNFPLAFSAEYYFSKIINLN